ncbi:predicted protein [Naegleria gruberi]|uniref:Flap endonuclease 1 n=1 Tax=Naegleria gruberi TaxID=5762 RepID=FEN1_NAEGR|nr:uncharacterized protein NAEGRDRAFT_44329 [Naegleria gruberi]D2V434.1 RecName: Full=Flap endonuclease 1; Short=FEN-1; AltName: Full=Flap structure-specific endonuclease 1 [Naegleria gruberi]EFC48453.1 predicted protein [Naegleria gruberi]|eukprot:XP_002681197.1 predicted protein [Naegleria gruberi strain NEG-M]
MGIKGLSQLILDEAKDSVKEDQLKNYFGRKVAIDASMAMYQFLIALKNTGMDLTDKDGEVTNHLQGLLARTTKMLEYGIKPCYVFDGKPPQLKSGELEKRKERQKEAMEQFALAQEEGDEEKMVMWNKRTTRMTKEQSNDGKKLLRLMGVPVVEAPGEAEAQCAELCKGGLVYATATEDMDALTYATPVLARHLTFSEARKQPIQEFTFKQVIEGLGVTVDQFIDICILCGCDYTDSIKGIGPKKALAMIKKYGNIENLLKNIEGKHYQAPSEFPYEEVRNIFKNPDVTPSSELVDTMKWTEPDEEGLIEFLVKEKQFDEERVRGYIKRIKSSRGKPTQTRLDGFFTPVASSSTTKKKAPAKKDDKKSATDKKRKAADASTSSKKKK